MRLYFKKTCSLCLLGSVFSLSGHAGILDNALNDQSSPRQDSIKTPRFEVQKPLSEETPSISPKREITRNADGKVIQAHITNPSFDLTLNENAKGGWNLFSSWNAKRDSQRLSNTSF